MKERVWNSMLEAVRNNEGYEDITHLIWSRNTGIE